MPTKLPRFLTLLLLAIALPALLHGTPQSGGDFSNNPHAKKLPTETIFVKGAWSSASDLVTPVPESGAVGNNSYTNEYFRLAYPLSPDWTQKYTGPPPSDSGYYVLAQIRPLDSFKGPARGSVLIAAQDLFFTATPATNAAELVSFTRGHLQPDFQVERPPDSVSIAGHSFVRFDYGSPAAELHWRVLATQIRCHALQFIFTSRDTKLLEVLMQQMNDMKLPVEAGSTDGTGGGDVPICLRDYATEETLIDKVDPILTERRFNPVPVRFVIDRQGKVKHIHFLSAFPEQAKAITDALLQWRFRPYLHDGQPVEVETGMWFGRAPRRMSDPGVQAVSE